MTILCPAFCKPKYTNLGFKLWLLKAGHQNKTHLTEDFLKTDRLEARDGNEMSVEDLFVPI